MAKKNKVRLKQSNPYLYYRNWFIGFKVAKYASILAPFITLFVMKFDEYFQLVDQGTQLKLSLGCVLALFVGGVAIYKEFKKGEGGSQASGVVGWAVAFALCYLLQSILADLTLIIGCALIGQLAGLGFEFGAENRAYYMNKYISYKKAKKGIFSEASKQAFSSLVSPKSRKEKVENNKIPYE